MKNKLVLTGILLPLLLISGCKKEKGNSESTILSTSHSSSTMTSQSSSSETKPSTISVTTDFDAEASIYPYCGTSLVDDNTVQVDGLLTDGSVNHLTGNVYTPSNDGKSIAKETFLNDDNFESEMLRGTMDQGNVYTVIALSISFSKMIYPSDYAMAILFDNEGSSFEINGSSISKAIRVGIISDNIVFQSSTGVSKVWAPLQTADNCKYVSDMDTISGTAYTNDIIDKDYSGGGIFSWDSLDNVKQRNDYLGCFRAGNQIGTVKQQLIFAVVIWFEGTDPELVNRNIAEGLSTFNSTLNFHFVEMPY